MHLYETPPILLFSCCNMIHLAQELQLLAWISRWNSFRIEGLDCRIVFTRFALFTRGLCWRCFVRVSSLSYELIFQVFILFFIIARTFSKHFASLSLLGSKQTFSEAPPSIFHYALSQSQNVFLIFLVRQIPQMQLEHHSPSSNKLFYSSFLSQKGISAI